MIEEEIRLDEYVRTGINIDGILTSQLLINILSIIHLFMTER